MKRVSKLEVKMRKDLSLWTGDILNMLTMPIPVSIKFEESFKKIYFVLQARVASSFSHFDKVCRISSNLIIESACIVSASVCTGL